MKLAVQVSLVMLVATFWGSDSSARELADDDWRFDASLYGWLPNINIKSSEGKKSGISRSDIVENLDATFLGAFVANRGRYLAGVDFVYLKISDKPDSTVTPGLTLRKEEIESVLLNPFIGYEFYRGEKHTMFADLGARYFWLKAKAQFRAGAPLPPGSSSVSASDSVWDAMVRIGGIYAFTDHWFVTYLGEVGGGDSDEVWGYTLGAGYRFERLAAEAGWRDLHYEFDSDSEFERLDFPGPYAGFTFSF